MEVKLVLDRETEVDEEVPSVKEEMSELEWSVIEENTLLTLVRLPHPIERMEVQCTSEGDELMSISVKVSVPVEVNDRRVSVSDERMIPNPS